MPGWCGLGCDDDCDECQDGTHGCSPYAECSNSMGSYACECKNEFFGNGVLCTPCANCGPGWEATGICETENYVCVNVDECQEQTDNCDDHATCTDNEGSFKCECDQKGADDEWWGLGVTTAGGECSTCTKCVEGWHEIEPCTSTTDRVCEVNVADGLYIMESEADDNRMCVALMEGEWFPSRVNYQNGDEYCGIAGETVADKKKALLASGDSIWKFTLIGSQSGKNADGLACDGAGLCPNNQNDANYQNTYLIEHNTGDGYSCLFFGDSGNDIYPSLQNCRSYDLTAKDDCPWANGGQDLPSCGFGSMSDLTANGQAIFRIQPVKLNENKFIIMS